MRLDRFFARAQIPDGLEDEVRALGQQGIVVFVMRSAGWLNLSFIRWLVRRLGLPALGAAIGLGRFFRTLIGGRGTPAALRAALSARAPTLIFLRRPSVFHARGVVTGAADDRDPFRILCEAQRTLGQPIFLVPILYVWSRRPQRLKPSLIDMVLGSTEAPGTLATIIAFYRNYQRAFVRVGRPINLADFLAAEARRGGGSGGSVEAAGAGAGDLALPARKVRGALYYHLSREARAVLGPPFKAARRVRDEVLRDRTLQEVIAAEARRRARPAAEIAKQAERMVREIAARMSPLFFELIRPLVVWICTRLYQGIELDEEGLAEVRQAANRGGLVLCPSHKSHMDYVMLTLLFYEKGLLPPHVAAGINLSFWPFGAIARWCGGFFIRRSFKGDHLYSAVVRAYVKRLMRDGFPQEFFIEGGRSRTGKLAFPKTGLLAMEVDAWRESTGDDLYFVPIAIDYEKLPEAKSYARELGGGEKQKESFGSLLEARKALRSRHGRIYVQFGQPISLETLSGGREHQARAEAAASATARKGDRDGENDQVRRVFVQSLANRIAYGINRASTITPVGLCAAALLSGSGDVSAAQLARRIDLLRKIALHDGARISDALATASADPGSPGPIGDALAVLARDGLVTMRAAAAGSGTAANADHAGAAERGSGRIASVRVQAHRRAELDFFRNNVIHHFVAYAIIAAARGAAPLADAPQEDGGAGAREGLRRAALERDTRWLSRLFKLEFMYRVGARFETIFSETVTTMTTLGLDVDVDLDAHRGVDDGARAFLAQMLHPYIDAYRAAAVTLTAWSVGDRKSFVKSALQRANQEVAAGRALPESASKTTLENAAAWLVGEGALEPRGSESSDRLRVAADWPTSRTHALVSNIERFRPRA